jgi:hypothetical protein
VCDSIDMALLLLQSYPDLAIAKDIYGQTPVLALASISSAYPGGNQLICWKQWIYNSEYHSLFSYFPFNYSAIFHTPWIDLIDSITSSAFQ